LTVSSGDFEKFSQAFQDTMLNPAHYLTNVTVASKKDGATPIFREYYRAYIAGKFITRRGATLSKPAITAKGIGNDVISSAFTVFLEASLDAALRTPVFYKKDPQGAKQFLNPGGQEPTASKLNTVQSVEVVQPGQCGISEREVEVIAFLSELAGDKSELLSGLVLETIGGGEISFGLGGHFSIGDNSTLVTLVKTFFEANARRAMEHVAYELFKAVPGAAAVPTAPALPVGPAVHADPRSEFLKNF
jgi:hypothetical protein